jgi:uncharacterized protein
MLKRWVAALAAGAALLFALSAAAEVPVPPLKARVTDLTRTLSALQIRALDERLRDFESTKGSQIAVLMLPSTQPETIEQYSIRVAEAWKIGRAKVDDGVILVIAKNDRKLRIEVGRGLEGAIPDAIAKRIVSDVIAPHFKSGDFYGGIAAGTGAIMTLIQGEGLPPPRPSQEGFYQTGVIVLLLLLAGLFVVVPLLLGWNSYSGRRRTWTSGGWGGGGWGGGGWGGGDFGGGGGFSGGGGDFGGGGASGSW